jgi:hypothetical protein
MILSVNQLIFIVGECYILFAVRTEYLNIKTRLSIKNVKVWFKGCDWVQ